MRKTVWGLGAVLGILVLWIVISNKPGDRRLYPAPPGSTTVTVYVLDNGFHSDIAIPRAPVARRGGASSLAAADLPDSPWLVVGWGDRRFFRESGMNLYRAGDAVRALFHPRNPSAVRMDALPAAPPQALPGRAMMPLTLSQAGFERLMARMDRTFTLKAGRPVVIERRQAELPQIYFASDEPFHILHMCNHWIGGSLLNAAGVPADGFFDSHSWGLMQDLRLRAGGARMIAPGAPVTPRAGG